MWMKAKKKSCRNLRDSQQSEWSRSRRLLEKLNTLVYPKTLSTSSQAALDEFFGSSSWSQLRLRLLAHLLIGLSIVSLPIGLIATQVLYKNFSTSVSSHLVTTGGQSTKTVNPPCLFVGMMDITGDCD